ncbi:MAG: ABC transporter permease, partial [Methanosarcinales archaeon]
MFLELAKRNLSRHTFRTVLAAIGIIIGVVAISSLGILGNSLKMSVTDTLGDIGNEIIVSPAFKSGVTNLTEKQFKQMERIDGIEVAIPISSEADVVNFKKESTYTQIYGMRGEDMQYILEIADGHFLKRDSDNCVVGSNIAKSYKLKTGSKISIDNNSFKVVGILKEKGLSFDISADNAVIISTKMYSKLYDTKDYKSVIIKVKKENLDEVDVVKENIEKRFNKRDDVVTVMAMNTLLEGVTGIFDTISMFLMGIGAISLIVAGVSILNVMLMSTMERTKEIGIMKAVGASKKEIILMFLLESLILGMVGSLIGGVLSFAGGFAILVLILDNAKYLFAPSSILYIFVGIGFGILTGLMGGLYPAWKASRLRPLDA